MVKSMKPGKQRKAHFNAPMHEKRKRVAARLQLKDRDDRFDGVRTVTVRVGDTVKVVRGDLANGGKRHGGKRGADPLVGTVIRIDSEKGRLYIEGANGPCINAVGNLWGRCGVGHLKQHQIGWVFLCCGN